MPGKFLDRLTEPQMQAVLHKDGPLLVLAGPGSGKTRVITCRIAALVDADIEPQNICAITFTNKAAEEMRIRCSELLGSRNLSHISTFHSLCVRILRRFADLAEIKPSFSIFDTTDQLKCMKQAVSDCELDSSRFQPSRILEAVSALKSKLIDPPAFEKQIQGDIFSKHLLRIYSRYQQILAADNALDFDDLLLKTANLLEKNPDICSHLGSRFRYLLIDEYQDTNYAQYKIAKLLVSSHNNICATGDPDQSIYRWRGADIRNILAFEKDWPAAKTIRLEQNFRSTPNILELADRLIAFNRHRKEKVLIPTRPSGSDIVIDCCDDEFAEAYNIVRHIKNLTQDGLPLRSIAVFYRINAMSRPLEETFIKNNIPYQIVRGVEFYNRKEIRDMLAYLKVLVNPADEIALLRIINTPARSIGKTTIDKIRLFAAAHHISLFDALKKAEKIDTLNDSTKAKIAVFVKLIETLQSHLSKPAAEIAQFVFEQSGLADDIKDEDALENIEELINAASAYDEQSDTPSLVDYLQQVSLFTDADSFNPNSDCVALMTLHCAKGLEFDNVFIIGLEEGLLPHEKSRDDEHSIEEERRLFFVGITRAKSNLHISYSRNRPFQGRSLRTVPSPFLYEIGFGQDQKRTRDNIVYDYNEPPHQPEQFYPYQVFRAGQLVKHSKFGLGTVEEFIDMGENSIVVIRFNNGQTKSIKTKYAHLVQL